MTPNPMTPRPECPDILTETPCDTPVCPECPYYPDEEHPSMTYHPVTKEELEQIIELTERMDSTPGWVKEVQPIADKRMGIITTVLARPDPLEVLGKWIMFTVGIDKQMPFNPDTDRIPEIGIDELGMFITQRRLMTRPTPSPQKGPCATCTDPNQCYVSCAPSPQDNLVWMTSEEEEKRIRNATLDTVLTTLWTDHIIHPDSAEGRYMKMLVMSLRTKEHP